MSQLLRRVVCSAVFVLAATSCRAAEPSADLVLTGGNIITMDPGQPAAEAVACRGDRILAVGDSDEIAACVGPETQVIRLDGLTVIPGFIEGHGHFVQLGVSRMILDLTQARQWRDIVELVRDSEANTTPDADAARWATGLDGRLRSTLEKWGLVDAVPNTWE